MRVFYSTMSRRFYAFAVLALGIVLVLAGFAVGTLGTAQTSSPRISFVLATGSTGGTYFPVGQAIAGIISHPPGVARCDFADVCGPAGLVASARTSPGAVANVRDVNAGRADGGLAQSDVIAEGVAGKGDFSKDGPQSHVRMIADLFPEDVHIVARIGAHIATVSDLRGKRVAIGPPESGTATAARAVLSAYRIPVWRLKASSDSAEIAAQKLQSGDIDAFVFVGGAPVELVRSLLGSNKAMLIPIDGDGRRRLLAEDPGFAPAVIASDVYPRQHGPVNTVSVRAIWVVNDAEPDSLVYAIAKALFNPANRSLLDGAHPSARFIREDTATIDMPVPLHAGASRFYREMGVAIAPRVAKKS